MRASQWIGLAAILAVTALAGCVTSGSDPRELAPPVENAVVLESLFEPVFTGSDFQPLFDRLAHDVVLEVTVSGDAGPRRDLRGKRHVMAFFLNEDALYGFGRNGPLEYSGRGDRVVVEAAEASGDSGITVGGRESAVVVDFENGRIVRFLVVQDAVPAQVAIRKSNR